MSSKAKQTGRFVKRRINSLAGSMHESAVKATLAHLRRGVGKHPATYPVTWEATFQDLPDELKGYGTQASYGELAVHTALTLFAMHQQSSDLRTQLMHKEGDSIGRAMGILSRVKAKDSKDKINDAVKKRFDKLATADSLEELSNHLRGTVQLLRSEGIGLDYQKLAEQLYNFQFIESRDGIRLNWGRDFYSTIIENFTFD